MPRLTKLLGCTAIMALVLSGIDALAAARDAIQPPPELAAVLIVPAGPGVVGVIPLENPK